MLELTSGVAADNGVPGKALGPGVAPTPPDSIMPPACVLLLQGASAVRGAALLVCTPSPKASCACPSACAISTSLKYSFSSSSAPRWHLRPCKISQSESGVGHTASGCGAAAIGHAWSKRRDAMPARGHGQRKRYGHTHMFSQHTHSVGLSLSAFEKCSSACALRFPALSHGTAQAPTHGTDRLAACHSACGPPERTAWRRQPQRGGRAHLQICPISSYAYASCGAPSAPKMQSCSAISASLSLPRRWAHTARRYLGSARR